MRRQISSFLLIFGAVFLMYAAYLSWQRFNPWRLSFSQMPVSKEEKRFDYKLPKKIVIKRLNINLPIIPAKISKNTWEVSDVGVSYLLTSAVPGDRGNAIFYGHNWTNLLGNITQAKTGDTIEIYFHDNKKYTFKIDSTAIVSPTQSDILRNTKDTRITLYTCTGFFDTQRFVIVGKLL